MLLNLTARTAPARSKKRAVHFIDGPPGNLVACIPSPQQRVLAVIDLRVKAALCEQFLPQINIGSAGIFCQIVQKMVPRYGALWNKYHALCHIRFIIAKQDAQRAM